MDKLILIGIVFIVICSILINVLMWIRIEKVSAKRKELKGFLEDRVIPDVNRAFQQRDIRLNNLENNMRSLLSIQQQSPQNRQILQTVQQPVQPSGENNKQKYDKNRDKENAKQQQKDIIKTIFLGINSEDFFFDNEVSDQKSSTSKFIGYLMSESEGKFAPIDVERIRSVNVAASVKQQGMVSSKDAQTFNVIEPGIIRKEDGGWLIVEPALVEYIK